MAKRYGESMVDFEREQDEQDWKRRCYIAAAQGDRQKILSLIEEGVENDYDPSLIERMEKQL